jgi:hypothetical protein
VGPHQDRQTSGPGRRPDQDELVDCGKGKSRQEEGCIDVQGSSAPDQPHTGQLGFSGMVLPGRMTSRSTCQCSQPQRKLVRHLGQTEPPVSRPDGGWPHHRRQALRQPPALPLRGRRTLERLRSRRPLHGGPELFYGRVEPIPELRNAGDGCLRDAARRRGACDGRGPPGSIPPRFSRQGAGLRSPARLRQRYHEPARRSSGRASRTRWPQAQRFSDDRRGAPGQPSARINHQDPFRSRSR